MTDSTTPSPSAVTSTPYRVLARSYRPKTFEAVIGQSEVVRGLTNAIQHQRIPHAILLTGIRGTGKTTLARLIARSLSCRQSDQPTSTPCGVCDECIAIDRDRHLDVLEFDAASRTGVDDIRELIDAGQYRALSGRYKIFIIDEVHMLSKSAFNALLKTLEEPPAHLIFIFATTEIEKIPPTILSRCVRYDLRRVDTATLANHITTVVMKEQGTIEPDAAQLLARAADGSVRDALSLLDQAFTRTEGHLTAANVQSLLGLLDRSTVLETLELLVNGDLVGCLQKVRTVYEQGHDMQRLLEDWMELVHHLTQLKLKTPQHEGPTYTLSLHEACQSLAERLSIPALLTLWQGLQQGLDDLSLTPHPLLAVEMMIVELLHQPSPANTPAPTPPATPKGDTLPRATSAPRSPVSLPPVSSPTTATPASVASEPPQPSRVSAAQEAPIRLASFEALVAHLKDHKELLLAMILERDVVGVACESPRLEIMVRPTAPKDLVRRLTTCLKTLTGEDWQIVARESTPQAPATLAEQAHLLALETYERQRDHPLTQAVLAAFPGATILNAPRPSLDSSLTRPIHGDPS